MINLSIKFQHNSSKTAEVHDTKYFVHRQTNRHTDGQTDRQADSIIP